MAYSKTWLETEPDGAVITVSQLDNYIRDTKIAVRERLEDTINSLNGLLEVGSFAGASMPKKGSGRFHADLFANMATVPLQDGRGYFTTDAASFGHPKLYSLEGAGAREIAYLNRDGSRTLEGPLLCFQSGQANLRAAADLNVVLGADNTNGAVRNHFVWIPFTTLGPTQVPINSATYAGAYVPIVFNTGDNKLYIRTGGTWKAGSAFV